MKLVGASWGFIRRPFLVRNVWIGVLAGIMADAILLGMAYILVKYEPQLIEIITPNTLLIVMASVFAFGLAITFLCAYISINKYLRMKVSALYYI
jgi:cell division transport system permease protein